MKSLASLARPWPSARGLHYTASTSYPRRPAGIKAPPLFAKTGLPLDVSEDIEEDKPYEERSGHGSSSAGHLLLRQQRHMLNYMRLIEHDMPNLVRFREPFVPPPSDRPLVVRTIDYNGEEHPATAKRTMVVAVARLPLHGRRARHTFKLLAGPRWFPSPPPDSGIGPAEGKDGDGYIKISCEDFPQPGMNLKWISDVLDRLVAEANTKSKTFADIPLDTRHTEAKRRRPSVKDFPQEWLPVRENVGLQ